MKILRALAVPIFSVLSLLSLVLGMIKNPWHASWIFFLWGPVQVAVHAFSGPVGALAIASLGSLVGLLGVVLNISQWSHAILFLICIAWLWVCFWWMEKMLSSHHEAIQRAQEKVENVERILLEKQLGVESARKVLRGLRGRQENYERLKELVDSLASSLSIDQLCHHVRLSLEKSLGPGRAALDLFGRSSQVFHKDSIVDRVIRQGRPLLIRDLARSFHQENASTEVQGTSLIAAPLYHGKEPVGLVRMYSVPPHFFDEADLRLLATVADIFALALANINLYAQVEALASKDVLTGLYVRYRFDEKLVEAFATARGAEVSLCLVMFDIDFFKKVNDVYGHIAGDEVLKRISDIIRQNCRDTDFASRYGGEELAVIMPHTKLTEARVFAERVRQAVGSEPMNDNGKKINVTISAGVASVRSWTKSAENFLREVDDALYVAKSNGRNKVVTTAKAVQKK